MCLANKRLQPWIISVRGYLKFPKLLFPSCSMERKSDTEVDAGTICTREQRIGWTRKSGPKEGVLMYGELFNL